MRHVFFFLCSFFELQTEPSCYVDVGGIDGQYGI